MALCPAGQKKVARVMREYHAGTLHHGGSKKIVKSSQTAKAIAMSEGRKKCRKKRK
jgi:hypothetical protein